MTTYLVQTRGPGRWDDWQTVATFDDKDRADEYAYRIEPAARVIQGQSHFSAAEMGAKGGQSRSAAKSAASRANLAKAMQAKLARVTVAPPLNKTPVIES